VESSPFVLGRSRWRKEGGYAQLLHVAFPLILSTGSWSLQHFVDRMFLAWYSPESIAASTPAGILNYTFMSLFLGTAGYVSTFVAQYYGAGRHDRTGPVVWQGVYIALAGAAVMALFVPAADPMFRLVGHQPEIQRQEKIFFSILCLGAFPAIAGSALAGFFSGRGETWPVMWVNLFATLVNMVLDYLLIFGRGGLPELGIAGAAISTNVSAFAALIAYVVLIVRADRDGRCRVLRGWRFDPMLFSRLIRFGLPSGLQFFIDMAGFTVFLLIVGRLGTVSLAATNIAFNINTLAFMPMIGLGMAISILVGQHLGRNDPTLAERCVGSGLHVTMLYMGFVALLYVLTPRLFLVPFGIRAGETYGEILALVTVLLRFVALYCLFDVLTIVFAAALRGAGDTRFVMVMIFCLSMGVLVVPSFAAIHWFGASIYLCWSVATAYVISLGLAFYLRYRSGVWTTMRVIER